ncbi:UDP binding domain-containing protein [Nonomuraea sp. SYSU D8015]|uniref:UDP binding domain-containing protein n=1 Tax=Nonomuraea sp. SYSU D8015 TaxID=2593644 RepID=UPI003FA56D50
MLRPDRLVFGVASPWAEHRLRHVSLTVAVAVREEGADVVVHDNVAEGKARRAHPELEYADTLLAAARDADLLMLLTDWTEFRDMDPHVLTQSVRQRNVVDARHALAPDLWRSAGWSYRT